MLRNLASPGTLTDLNTGEVWAPERFCEEIERRVAWLLGRGLGPSPRVLIAHAGTPAFFADLFAVWHLGACAACVDSGLSAPELDNLVRFFEPELVLLDASFGRSLAVPSACSARELPPAGGELPPAAGRMEDPALVLFTSGTTGDPKGVVHTFRSLLARVSFNRYEIGKRALERSLCLLPTHFGHGLIGNCLTPLYGGHHLFLWGGFRRDPARLGAIIDEHEIRFFSSVPTHWKLALESAAPPRGASLRRVHIGSAPLSAELWRAAQAWSGVREVVNAYGITEAANWICGASAAELEPEDGLIGKPWGGEMCVRDEAGDLHQSGEGELMVRNPALMRGYLAREDLTLRVMQDGWFRTGDFGSLDEGGVARLCGRYASAINRSGVKLYPEDIDLVLERHPDVREACAFALSDEIHGEVVAAAVRVAPGASLSPRALEEWCRERLRRQAVPGAWFFLDEIPKTERGKVSRERVREACLRGGK